MPGKSQLEKFSSDLLSLGDEVNLRAARGEQPVRISIPKDVSEENDSEEFVLGMPIIEAEPEAVEVDDDLSDLTGLGIGGETSEGETDTPAPSFEAPDMSALLDTFESPIATDGDMPDLSMFQDTPVEEEVEEEIPQEPEEISVSDMSLDDLLSSGGFDQPEEEEVQEEPEEKIENPVEPSLIDDLNDYDDLEDLEDLDENEPTDKGLEPFDDIAPIDSNDDISSFDNVEPLSEPSPFDDFTVPTEDNLKSEIEGNEENPFSLDNLNVEDTANEDEELPSLDDDIEDIEEVEELEELDSGDEESDSSTEEYELPDIPLDDEDNEEPIEDLEETDDIQDLPSLDEDLDIPTENDSSTTDESFNLDDMDIGSEPVENIDLDEELPSLDEEPIENTDDDFDIPDLPDLEEEKEEEETTPSGFGVDDFNLPEDNVTDNDVPAFNDLNLDDLPDMDAPTSDEDFSSTPEGLFDANDVEFDANEDIPELDDFNVDGGSEDAEELPSFDETQDSAPIETFDTSEMDGFDFDIPDTDSQLSGADDDSAFDIPKDDGIGFDESFEIPGFSDVETIKEQKSTTPILKSTAKNKKNKGKRSEEINEDETAEELPPNTLTDKQYKIFRKNLSEYPLNVRLAFEDFIVKDEFTEEAEFEVIEMVLNKASARQLATNLEKKLDISIPVPRDFEHRSAEEYEAYKKSISYQLKNKIIPGFLMGIAALLVCIGLFNFGKNCIYKPLKANKLYKQGYVLLQETEYPLSEVKFNEATEYRLNKKWFYKYARGYREHKQYQRAGKMYQNILYCFKHDKQAGLEYADMELNDLANYPRAEEIVRREVLDYHINDADGILMLGDIFLEWATEKDPSMFEMAREQYATLIQLYGATDLYLSRMMRYFIRTDNLLEVLQLKQNFEPREKSLCADDWTELSGYLLDKYYGELAPSEEYLRYQIEGLRGLLLRAVKMNPNNPIALYNLGRYFIETNEYEFIEPTLQDSIERFNAAEKMKSRDIYKYIDAYRLLGEYYVTKDNFLQAQEQFAEGISLYIAERDNAGFMGNAKIGKLYEDMGDIKYTISGDYSDALLSYSQSVNLGNDSPKIRYRMGYINYNNHEYEDALDAFMKAGDGYIKERNLLLAMANTLSLRGDDYAAEGYYEQLMESLDNDIASEGLLLPQAKADDFDLVNTYLCGSNNYGVTLHRLAKKTGDSSKNAQAIVQLSESLKAWDALTRNPDTMVRLEGSNLAEQNIKYITHPLVEFEPEIYTNISKTLLDNEKL